MDEEKAKWIYDTLSDLLLEEYRVPGVENAFADGTPCAVLYAGVLESQSRLLRRLHVSEDDPDLEQIIENLTQISKILGCKMFEYGVRYSHNRLCQETTHPYHTAASE